MDNAPIAPKSADSVPVFFWLWLPILVIIGQLAAEASLSVQTRTFLMNEDGPYETLQFFVIGAGFCVAVATLRRMSWKKHKWLFAWIALAAVCCFYVAGEEISWGQQWVHWATPEYWAHINDQDETNLHNTSSWLDQKPRLILEIGVLAGGLVFPLLRRFTPALLPKRFNIIYPPNFLWVTSLMVLFIKAAHFSKASHIFVRASEVEETYFYYFVLVYLVVMRRRILSSGGMTKSSSNLQHQG